MRNERMELFFITRSIFSTINIFYNNVSAKEKTLGQKNFAEKSNAYSRRYAENFRFAIFGDFPGVHRVIGLYSFVQKSQYTRPVMRKKLTQIDIKVFPTFLTYDCNRHILPII